MSGHARRLRGFKSNHMGGKDAGPGEAVELPEGDGRTPHPSVQRLRA